VALEASAYLQVHPSFTEPQFILPYNQASGAFDSLPDSKVEVRLGTGDLLVYAKRIDVRTQVAAGQAAFNELPSCSIFASQLSTATYLQRVNAQYDHHDTAAADQWGFSIVDAYRHAMWQGHNQFMRNALLYGYNPVNGEGLMNGSGSTATSLPADSNGNTTISTYDNGQLAFYFLQLILGIKTRTYQLGVQYQRAGAGSATTAGLVKDITADNGDTIKWVYDDTLIGKGAGGTDAILIVMPKVEVVEMGGGVPNTNIFAQLMPSMGDCTKMYCDMVAPREIPTPVPYGGINVLSEIRVTSGWPVRPEAVTILSAAYS
jgi:hypothetical protein